jgi:hypothetical protein
MKSKSPGALVAEKAKNGKSRFIHGRTLALILRALNDGILSGNLFMKGKHALSVE